MPRKPKVLEVASSAHRVDKGLAVRDGLREVRFNVRRGARKLVEAVEAATHRGDASARGPLGMLREPLNLTVRTTASLLSNVDRAAVDVLTSDGQYRSMAVPLVSSASHFAASGAMADLRAFTADHHWRYRHWLAMRQIGDVFVHEQGIALAGMQVSEALAAAAAAAPGGNLLEAGAPADAAVQVMQALMRNSVLTYSMVLDGTDPDQIKELVEIGAVVVVLAGELAGQPHELGGRDRYALTLRLADEIAVANRLGWKAALHSRAPVEAMRRWIAFVVQYA